MATIYERKNKDGSISYRVQIRRKDIPFFSITFTTLKEAKNWIKTCEHLYIENHKYFIATKEKYKLIEKREKEFSKKGIKTNFYNIPE